MSCFSEGKKKRRRKDFNVNFQHHHVVRQKECLFIVNTSSQVKIWAEKFSVCSADKKLSPPSRIRRKSLSASTTSTWSSFVNAQDMARIFLSQSGTEKVPASREKSNLYSCSVGFVLYREAKPTQQWQNQQKTQRHIAGRILWHSDVCPWNASQCVCGWMFKQSRIFTFSLASLLCSALCSS